MAEITSPFVATMVGPGKLPLYCQIFVELLGPKLCVPSAAIRLKEDEVMVEGIKSGYRVISVPPPPGFAADTSSWFDTGVLKSFLQDTKSVAPVITEANRRKYLLYIVFSRFIWFIILIWQKIKIIFRKELYP
jgi:hypothetical protein